jgi:flavodoxin
MSPRKAAKRLHPDRAARAIGHQSRRRYFTRSGNTRVIAGQLHRELKADLFEIHPATPYPEDYEQTVEQARKERDAGVRPPLKATAPNIAAYDMVFLCFPIWGETAPPVIRSFLAAHDLSDKTVRPVITHGGYGLGDNLAVLKSQAPNARLASAFDGGVTLFGTAEAYGPLRQRDVAG